MWCLLDGAVVQWCEMPKGRQLKVNGKFDKRFFFSHVFFLQQQ